MKTEDLITALATDSAAEADGVARAAVLLLPAGVALLAAIFFAAFGLRPDLASAMPATLGKLGVTLALAASCLWLALRAARSTDFALPAPLLLACAPIAMAVWLGFELSQTGFANWGPRLLGRNFLHCLALIPLLALPPLGALILVLRRGAVTRPAFAGFVSGLAAAGMGASFYALNCSDDSALFGAVWYSAASLIVAAIGAALATRFVRW